MLRSLILVAAGAVALAAPAAQREDRGAAAIEKQLAGRIAARPQSCINPNRSDGSTRYGDTLLIRGVSGVTYLSNFAPGCAPRGDNYAMVTRRPSTLLCRGDIVEFRDLTSGAFGGACPYGDFTPYRRAR